MDYTLRNITEEIYKRLRKEGKYEELSVEESQTINSGIARKMIKAERKHKINQTSSRKKSAEIIFNA